MRAALCRRSALTGVVTLLCGLAVFGWRLDSDRESLRGTRVLAAEPGQSTWYRGNLHTHSFWSDGDDYPEMIALWYQEHGYQFLVFTDHNVLHKGEKWTPVNPKRHGIEALQKLQARFPQDWIEQRTRDGKQEVRLKSLEVVSQRLSIPGKFLLIQGEEISDHFAKLPLHINVSNTPELIIPRGGQSVEEVLQSNVDAAVALRERTGKPLLVHVNHPNFGYAITAEELARIRGENFFEVYNGHPRVYNRGDSEHASTDRIWDILLTLRLAELNLPLMYGLANDDSHNYHTPIPSKDSNPGRGWVMVLADKLSPESLIESLEAGRFYASSGVKLNKVISGPKGLKIEVAPEPGVQYDIDFIGTRTGYDKTSSPVVDKEGKPLRTTRRYSDDVGVTLRHVNGTHARYEFQGNELYVRALITSTRHHPNPAEEGELERAWVQPQVGPAGQTTDAPP